MTEASQAGSCNSRIGQHLDGRIADLGRLWRNYRAGEEAEDETFSEYGLAFDFVAAHMFADQPEAYFRYQLSWGGPSDEFRFFVNPDLSCHRIEYWFLDWFDGASLLVSGGSAELLSEIWDYFREAGIAAAALKAGVQ